MWDNTYIMEHINREKAYEILTKYMVGQNYIDHSLAVEAIMKKLAEKLAPDEVEFWGICGLLHDLDEEHCDWTNHPETHGPTSVEILKKEGVNDEILFNAIMAHNPDSSKKAETTIEHAIIAADPMSGFIKAIAQIYPDKKVSSVKPKSVTKRFKETRFAAGANREYMMHIERCKIPYAEFAEMALDAMKDFEY